jgi:hypothetical protein
MIGLPTVWLLAVLNAAAPIPFHGVAAGLASHIDQRSEIVIRSQSDWQLLWSRHDPGTTPPVVDFSRDMLIALFRGFSTGGRSVRINSVARDGGRLVVQYREGVQEPCNAATTPYEIVAVDRQSGSAQFVEIREP